MMWENNRRPGGGDKGGGGEVEYRYGECPLCGEEIDRLSSHLPECEER